MHDRDHQHENDGAEIGQQQPREFTQERRPAERQRGEVDAPADQLRRQRSNNGCEQNQSELEQQPERRQLKADCSQRVGNGTGQVLDVVQCAFPVEPICYEPLGICPQSGPISDRTSARHPLWQAVRGYAHVRPEFVGRTADDAAKLPRFRR
jgi:hypothetical protein